MKFIYLHLTVVLFICSCTKSDSNTPANPDLFKQEAVTKVYFSNYPKYISFKNRTADADAYEENTSGQYRIEFHGLNGRKLIETNSKYLGASTNIVGYPITVGDTFRIFKNDKKYRDYVTEVEDNLNDGILYTYSVRDVTITQTISDEVKLTINTFTAPAGPMSSLKYAVID